MGLSLKYSGTSMMYDSHVSEVEILYKSIWPAAVTNIVHKRSHKDGSLHKRIPNLTKYILENIFKNFN